MFLSVLLYCGAAAVVAGVAAMLFRRQRRRGVALFVTGITLVLIALCWPVRERRLDNASSRLGRIMPRWQFEERHEIRIAAPPDRIYAAIRQVTAGEIRFFRILAAIRCLGRCRGENILNAPDAKPILDAATRSGFRVLADDAPHELVIGTRVEHQTYAVVRGDEFPCRVRWAADDGDARFRKHGRGATRFHRLLAHHPPREWHHPPELAGGDQTAGGGESMTGEVVSLWIKRAHRGVMDAVGEAQAVTGRGLAGNADQGGRRQVTIIDEAAWRAAAGEAGAEVDPSKRRANVMLRGIALADSRDKLLHLGGCVIRILGETRPCERMDEAQTGLRQALRAAWRGGVFGEVIEGGVIRVGDPAELEVCAAERWS